MAFKFGGKKAEPAPVTGSATPATVTNEGAKKRQMQMMALIGGVAVIGGAIYVSSSGNSDTKKVVTSDGTETRVKVDDMGSRNLNEGEWIARSENDLARLQLEVKNLQTSQQGNEVMRKRIDTLEQQNSALKADGQRLFTAMSTENEKLRRQMNTPGGPRSREATAAEQAASAPPNVGTGRWRGEEPFRVEGGGARSPSGGGVSPASGMPGMAEVKTLNFSASAQGKPGARQAGFNAQAPDAEPTIIEASADYLPPNSYAPARVIVGVDASAGVVSQTDPLPVLLRITGPARSVINDGKLLTTKLEGCVVTGAARGDLSAEKVYVKLVKMTCDQPNGRVAVTDVKGFISFAGKAGVRGRVVSREGNLVTQAMLAGVIGGFGRGFTANANALFSGATQVIDGERQQMSSKDIAVAGLGQGMGDAADTVSKYLIERAEQYQPVIEMPTGIDVEVVFLDGVYVRGQ